MNLVMPLLNYAARQPDKIALSDGLEKITYAKLVQRMKKIARGFSQIGLAHDKVAIVSTNRIEFIEVFLGCIYAGNIPVSLDPKWSLTEVNAVIQRCQPAMIFTELVLAKDLVVPDSEVIRLTFGAEEAGSYEQWLGGLTPDADLNDTNEMLFIGFTSGTTGVPKGYMRTHKSWITSFEATKEAFQLDNMEHIMAPGPFVHSLSLFALMQSLYCGATFHIVQAFHAPQILERCEQIPEMILFVVPTMIEALMQEAVPGQTQIQALISAGGKWTEASKTKCREVFGGAKLYEYYGSSEASYISYMDVNNDNKPNSLGKPFAGVEVSIRDGHFRELPAGITGQLYIRSDMIFTGYDQMPEETAAVFREDWLKLGDYMWVDEEGYLYLAGRSNNMMVTGGLNVFPEEVEAVLQQLPEIQEVMVLGVPDEYWGDKVTALVQWRGEQRMAEEEIKSYCRQHLASYKAPRQLITVDRFIYTSSGKLARQAMKDYMKRVMK